MKELYLSNNNISDCGVLSQLSNLDKLYLNNNKIENVSFSVFLDLSEFYMKEQDIKYTLDNTLNYNYQDIITKAKISSNKIYSKSGLEFVNCKQNSTGTGVTVTNPTAKDIYIKIKSGSAEGTKVNLKISDTEPPNISVTGIPERLVSSAELTIKL